MLHASDVLILLFDALLLLLEVLGHLSVVFLLSPVLLSSQVLLGCGVSHCLWAILTDSHCLHDVAFYIVLVRFEALDGTVLLGGDVFSAALGLVGVLLDCSLDVIFVSFERLWRKERGEKLTVGESITSHPASLFLGEGLGSLFVVSGRSSEGVVVALVSVGLRSLVPLTGQVGDDGSGSGMVDKSRPCGDDVGVVSGLVFTFSGVLDLFGDEEVVD